MRKTNMNAACSIALPADEVNRQFAASLAPKPLRPANPDLRQFREGRLTHMSWKFQAAPKMKNRLLKLLLFVLLAATFQGCSAAHQQSLGAADEKRIHDQIDNRNTWRDDPARFF
jgi:hypothetical protein